MLGLGCVLRTVLSTEFTFKAMLPMPLSTHSTKLKLNLNNVYLCVDLNLFKIIKKMKKNES